MLCRYGILGALFGRKLMWLTKFLRRFPTTVGQFLCGIPGSNTVMAGDNAAFAHSEEFIMVRLQDRTTHYVIAWPISIGAGVPLCRCQT